MSERILIIDDKKSLVEILETSLSQEGYDITSFTSGLEGMKAVQEGRFDLVLCDVRLPDLDGMEILRNIRSKSPDTSVVMITAYGSIENAIECMKLGADDYVTKPFNLEEIKAIVAKGLEKVRLRRENIALKAEVAGKYEFENIIGKSKPMLDVFDKIRRLARSDVNVLITGETGTGKELVSKAIHYQSDRCNGPFVALNCAAIPENLLESELYGHVRGAFTGAISNKRGMFEEASGGTLLLDEIAELHPSLQAKLLRTLDEGKIRRVGDTRHIDVNARLICSTNKNLEDEVRENRFRLDLYHRVRVIEIKLPPLRERKEDIPILIKHFLLKICEENSKTIPEIDPPVMRALIDHKWIGNVRELINTIEQAVLLCEDNRISEHCTNHILAAATLTKPDLFDPDMTLKEMVGTFEREAIRQALAGNSGNRKETARKLGISERSLYYKMEEYKLN